jgi:small conductance mechanosensitive channel
MDAENLIERLREAALAWGPDLIAAAAILVLGWMAAKTAAGLVRRSLSKAQVDTILVRFVGNMVSMIGMALVVIATLGKLGVNTTSFAAIIAAAGLAIGLAFQGTLSNFAAGVLLIFFRPFSVGDFVEAGGVSGSVEEVQVFTTVLNTPDNKRVTVPNAEVMGGSITNYSANGTRRVDMVFGIAYEDDIARAKDILACRPWVDAADYWAVKADVTEKAKLAFDAAGLSIPFPQTDVHLHAISPAA